MTGNTIKTAAIDFEYTFAEPHTITLSRPSASQKVIAEVAKEGIRFMWAFESQKNDYPLAWTQHPIDVRLAMNISVDKNAAGFTKWYRHESGAPYMFVEGNRAGVEYTVSAIATKSGIVVKTLVSNSSEVDREAHIQFAHLNMWVISNKGWIDGIHNNVLISGNQGRADRLLVVASGADDYPMYGCRNEKYGDEPPMSNMGYGIAENSMKKIVAYFHLKKGESKTGYFFIPYKKYFEDLEKIRGLDLEQEIRSAVNEWKKLLRRGTEVEICDRQFMQCYHACLADMFVMRERIGKYVGIVCGTLQYRSANSSEPLEAEILLDTLGYTKEAVRDYPMYLEGQNDDGCWVTRKGWEHEGWGFVFNKANAVITHYQLTQDKAFLEKYYPRLYASTMFNHRMRQSTKSAMSIAERGLMPRGMGDCGMMNNADYYGVFYPSNALCVGADFKTLEAAKILGRTEDVEILERICEEAKTALLKSMRENVIQEDGYVRTATVANAAASSIYGCMYSYFPCGLVKKEEPMIDGSVRYIETKQISEGGLPMGTGWMKEGLWVAMALNNIARTYLRMGLYEKAKQYLYPALNHATPFITWCEERGAEKNSAKISGDRQHLWTPLSVLQYTIDALFFEDESAVHLFAGAYREWMSERKRLSVKGLKTAYGDTTFSLERKNGSCKVRMKTDRRIEKTLIVHFYSEEGISMEYAILPSSCEIECIVWEVK